MNEVRGGVERGIMIAVLPSSAILIVFVVDWFPSTRYASVELVKSATAPDPPGSMLQAASKSQELERFSREQLAGNRRLGRKLFCVYGWLLSYCVVDVLTL